ncbi:uncharacterized protein [Phaseolus vulgaris]|uniref:uncharacterized protein isoform X1 n=2 Tax=Phaseolus vulgaris TaxID=3885 RepID=UPI0035CCA593
MYLSLQLYVQSAWLCWSVRLAKMMQTGSGVGKALVDGQLLDVYFTPDLYKHILGVKVTCHDIEAVDPDYYMNLKWMLEISLEGFKALQGISGLQRFQIHKAYVAPNRLPSAHTW